MMKELFSVFVTASALAMDAFSVSLATSACIADIPLKYSMRMVFFFALFQFFMPLIGGVFGCSLSAFVARWDHWIALVVLVMVGGNMIREAFSDGDECSKFDISSLYVVTFLAIATSLDAMAVGFSLSTLNESVMYVAVSTGIITGVLSFIGVRAGARLGMIIGRRAQIVGGFVLCLIGVNILATHLNWY